MRNWPSDFLEVYLQGVLIAGLLSGALLCTPASPAEPPQTLESKALQLYFGGPIAAGFNLCESNRRIAPETSFVMLHQKFCHEDWRNETVVVTVFSNGPEGRSLQFSSPANKELKTRWLRSPNPEQSLLLIEEAHAPGGAANTTASIYLMEKERAERILHEGLVFVHTGSCNWYWNEIVIEDSSSPHRITFTIRAFRDLDKFCFDPKIPDTGAFPTDKGLRGEVKFRYEHGKFIPDKRMPDYRAYISTEAL